MRTTTIQTTTDSVVGEDPAPTIVLPRRQPHVILSLDEVRGAVDELLQHEDFVIDVETTGGGARSNTVTWIGLGGPAKVYLIPVGHPHGVQITPERRIKTPAFLHFPADDPRGKTKLGKPSTRMIEHSVPATFAPPPKQLYAHEAIDALRPLLFSDRGKIGHNVKYDLQSIAKYLDGEIPPGPYHDTILVRHTLAEDLQDYSLKALTCEWFRIPHARRKIFYPNLGAQGVDNFGLDIVARYLAKDLRYCWLMYQHFMPRLVHKGLLDVYDFEMTVYPVLMRMEQQGFPVDLSLVDAVKADLDDRIGVVEQQCWVMAGDQFSLSDTNVKRWVLFGEGKPRFGQSKRQLLTQGLRVRERTEKEQLPTVNQAVLEYYATRGNSMAEFLLEWSLLEKLRGTFIGHPEHDRIDRELDPIEKKWVDVTVHVPKAGLYAHAHFGDHDLPTVHTSFKQHGTVTGRLSSAVPNLQQLPRGSTIRSLFVAGPGRMLIVADYDQIELRCAAYLSQDPEMIRVFMEGQDIHRLAAATMMRKALEDVTDAERQVGKTQNFGTLYGAGPNKIAQVAGVTKQRAQQFIERYFDRFGGLKAWMDFELQNARLRGNRSNPLSEPPHVVIPPNGRLRRLPDLYSMDSYERWRAERQAINAIVQGFASNITKQAMIDLGPVLSPYPASMVAQVHDEIVTRTEEICVWEVLPLVIGTMGDVRDPLGKPIIGDIPLIASGNVGQSWAEAKGGQQLPAPNHVRPNRSSGRTTTQ